MPAHRGAAAAGGAYSGTFNNCTLIGNSAVGSGGGAFDAVLNQCTLSGNSAGNGGGSCNGTLNTCILTGNSAQGDGGGTYGATLNNCTVTGNSAQVGGGTYGGWLNNCIVWFNTARYRANHEEGFLNHCCTLPLPEQGSGNISLDPQLASASHLSANSPCRGAGNAAFATGTDTDGESWAQPPSIGCDELWAGTANGPLTVATTATHISVAAGFDMDFTGIVTGRAAASAWEFGDGVIVSNRPYATHAWTMPGNHEVILHAYNESFPGGVSATVTVHVVVQPVHYVAAGSTNPVTPYSSWATAATNIQDAVDGALVTGALVLVTNGIYTPVSVIQPVALHSVNGPAFTLIDGGGTARCMLLANGASLSGFTLTNGIASGWGGYPHYRESGGGGVWCESPNAVVSNCVISGNSAYCGGGAWGGTLSRCTLSGNSVDGYGHGGGAAWSTLNHCALTHNSADTPYGAGGGGAAFSTLNGCTLISNTAEFGGGASACTLKDSALIGNLANGGGGGVASGYGSSSLNGCTLAGNTASRGGGMSAGLSPVWLNNCILSSNSAQYAGGGADFGTTLNNCTLIGNAAGSQGGGAFGCFLNNCIIYFNTAPDEANYVARGWPDMNHCCTTPLPTNGVGHITNAPLFVDLAAGNLRLQSNSPCINAGNNAYATSPTDIDGNPRIVSGTADIGAYEFQGPGSLISYAWLQQFGLPTDGSADCTDPDADGHNTWQEWRCQTCPTNALSVLRLLSATNDGIPQGGMTLTWESVVGVNYFLECTTNLAATPCFTPLATNVPGQAGTTAYIDTNAAGAGSFFYRVGVGN